MGGAACLQLSLIASLCEAPAAHHTPRDTKPQWTRWSGRWEYSFLPSAHYFWGVEGCSVGGGVGGGGGGGGGVVVVVVAASNSRPSYYLTTITVILAILSSAAPRQSMHIIWPAANGRCCAAPNITMTTITPDQTEQQVWRRLWHFWKTSRVHLTKANNGDPESWSE